MKWTKTSPAMEVDEEVQSHEVDEKVGLYEWLFSLQLEHSTRDQVQALTTGVAELVAVAALDRERGRGSFWQAEGWASESGWLPESKGRPPRRRTMRWRARSW